LPAYFFCFNHSASTGQEFPGLGHFQQQFAIGAAGGSACNRATRSRKLEVSFDFLHAPLSGLVRPGFLKWNRRMAAEALSVGSCRPFPVAWNKTDGEALSCITQTGVQGAAKEPVLLLCGL
jgi:hypothetical protein